MATVVQHPRRLHGLRTLHAHLTQRLNAELTSAIASMGQAVAMLAGIVGATYSPISKRLLANYEETLADLVRITSAPMPMVTDLAALGRRLMALSESMDALIVMPVAANPAAFDRVQEARDA